MEDWNVFVVCVLLFASCAASVLLWSCCVVGAWADERKIKPWWKDE